MILPDVNILLHAYDLGSRQHERARAWWQDALSGMELVGLAWVTLLGFIRLTTDLAVYANPWPVEEALDRVEEWLAQPNVRILPQPTVTQSCWRGFSAAPAPPAT